MGKSYNSKTMNKSEHKPALNIALLSLCFGMNEDSPVCQKNMSGNFFFIFFISARTKPPLSKPIIETHSTDTLLIGKRRNRNW